VLVPSESDPEVFHPFGEVLWVDGVGYPKPAVGEEMLALFGGEVLVFKHDGFGDGDETEPGWRGTYDQESVELTL